MSPVAPVRLRGHHLLCLLGYRGMGYSKAFIRRMDRVHERLRQDTGAMVRLCEGPDELCRACPPSERSHCVSARVAQRDARVLARIDVPVGACLAWGDLSRRLAERVVPGDIARWCAGCPWEPLGLCAGGLERLRAGGGLLQQPSGSGGEV